MLDVTPQTHVTFWFQRLNEGRVISMSEFTPKCSPPCRCSSARRLPHVSYVLCRKDMRPQEPALLLPLLFCLSFPSDNLLLRAGAAKTSHPRAKSAQNGESRRNSGFLIHLSAWRHAGSGPPKPYSAMIPPWFLKSKVLWLTTAETHRGKSQTSATAQSTPESSAGLRYALRAETPLAGCNDAIPRSGRSA